MSDKYPRRHHCKILEDNQHASCFIIQHSKLIICYNFPVSMIFSSISANPFGSRIRYCIWLKPSKTGKFPYGYACITGISVFEMFFLTSELPECISLQSFRQLRKWLVFQTVRKLPLQILVGQISSRFDEVWLYRLIFAPHDVFKRFSGSGDKSTAD